MTNTARPRLKTRPVWLFVLIALLALGLRAPLIGPDAPLLPDEALFATFARHISHENNPLLLADPVDKPPLTFYVTALSFKLFGNPSAWAARLPNVFVSLLTLAVAWALARRLYDDERVAALAALIVALSPLDIALSATVFTDSQATLWALLACLLAVRGRWGWAGLSAGLAFACKQSAGQFVPLAVALGVVFWKRAVAVEKGLHFNLTPSSLRSVSPSPLVERGSKGVRFWRIQTIAPTLSRFVAALGLVIALTFVWGAARGTDSPDWWALGAANNAPDRLIRADEVGPRLAAWLGFLAEGVGDPLLVALLVLGPALLVLEIRRRPRRRHTVTDMVLTAYVLGYVLLYWLAAFNAFDRYAHFLVPLLALLLARAAARAAARIAAWVGGDPPVAPTNDMGPRGASRRAPTDGSQHTSDFIRRCGGALRRIGAPILVALLMLPGALQARAGETPPWAGRAQYIGITQTAAYLNTLPPGTIVYDHWLGWALGWYTGQDRPPGMWLRITYYPTPEALAEAVLVQPDPAPRYFVVPGWVWDGPWLRALAAGDLAPQAVAQFGQFTVYRLALPDR